MCESTAYILRDGKEEIFFEDIESLEKRADEVEMVNIFGEKKTIRGKVKRFSLIDHKIILEPQ